MYVRLIMVVDLWVDRTRPPPFWSGGDILCFVSNFFRGAYLQHTIAQHWLQTLQFSIICCKQKLWCTI